MFSSFQSQIVNCDTCRQLCSTIGEPLSHPPLGDHSPDDLDPDLQQRIGRGELEWELAQSKVALAKAECKNEEILRQLSSAVAELQASKGNSWFQKTLTSIKEATTTAAAGNAKEKDAKEGKDFTRKGSFD